MTSGFYFKLEGFLPSGRSAADMAEAAKTLEAITATAKGAGLHDVEATDRFAHYRKAAPAANVEG